MKSLIILLKRSNGCVKEMNDTKSKILNPRNNFFSNRLTYDISL